MKTFARFYLKEISETLRTWRLPVVGGMVAFFALTGPILALYTPQILSSMQSSTPGVVITVPDPTWLDAYAQWLKNLTQLVAFVSIIAISGAVASEVANGTAVMVVTKPVSRAVFVIAKWAAFFTVLCAVVAIGAAMTQGVTLLLFDEAPSAVLWSATLVWLAYAAVLTAVGVFFSCVVSTLSAAALTIGAFFIMSVASLWKPVADYTAAGLSGLSADVLAGKEPALTWPLVSAGVTVIAVLALAAWSFERREL